MQQPSSSKPKRVLFCFFRQEIQRKALIKFVNESDFEFVGLISNKNHLGEKADMFMRIKEVYEESLFKNNTAPVMPPRSLLEAMVKTEPMTLKMGERRHKNPWRPWEYEHRKRSYLEQVTYAYWFIKEHNFDQIIYSHQPHNTFDYILYAMCKELGLKLTYFHHPQVHYQFFYSDTIENMFDPINDYLESGKVPEDPELPENLEHEIKFRKGEGVPFYMDNSIYDSKTRLYKWQKVVFKRDTYMKPIQGALSKMAYWRMRKINKPPKEKYIYFALHFQPESSTSPTAGVFVDQYYVALYLARSVPEGIKIVMKENPIQRAAYRQPEFYTGLAREKNIVFATLKTSTFELIENSMAVATVNGTVGWEAVFKQKPVFMFGSIFYQYLKGVVKVDNQEDIISGVQAILDGNFEVADDREIRRFLYAYGKITHYGIFDQDYLITCDSDVETEVENVLKVFREVI